MYIIFVLIRGMKKIRLHPRNKANIKRGEKSMALSRIEKEEIVKKYGKNWTQYKIFATKKSLFLKMIFQISSKNFLTGLKI